MKLTWKSGILIALTFFGVGFIVGWHPTFESVRNFIIGGISLGLVIEVVGLLRELFKERREERTKKREKLEGYVHIHNQEMIDKIIKYWFHENERLNEERQRTIEHLQEGYPDIWNLKLECDSHRGNLLKCDNYIKSDIKNKLAPDVPPFGFDKNFKVENIEWIIYKEIETILKKGYVPENYTAHLTLFGFRFEDRNEKYLVDKKEKFRKRIETIIKDKTLYEKFKTLTQEKELLDEKTNRFKQSIEDIKHDFEKRHIELKGTCKDCKDWHDELNSLK